jgi:hemolysin D
MLTRAQDRATVSRDTERSESPGPRMVGEGATVSGTRPPARVRETDGVGRDAAEFLGTINPTLARVLVYIVLLFVLAALVWMWLGRVDLVASAPFRLVPLGLIRSLQAPRDGRIESIYVRAGDTVSGGGLILKLSSRETHMDLRELERATARLDRARYDLEAALPREQALAREAVAGLERRLALTRELARVHRAAIASFRETAPAAASRSDVGRGLVSGASDLASEIRFRTAEMEHLKVRYEACRALYGKGLISRVQLDEARVRYSGALAQLPARMSEVDRFEMTMQDLKGKILQANLDSERQDRRVRDEYREAALARDRALKAVGQNLEEDSDLILAPEKGLITRVLVNVEGQVVSKGQILVSFAPSSAPLVAEASVLDRDVGNLRVGQAVKLKYEAYPYVDYGIRAGTLLEISPDSEVDPLLGPVYRATVGLRESCILSGGEERPLMYGMKGIAEIVTDRQSILHLAMRPLREINGTVTYAQEGGER